MSTSRFRYPIWVRGDLDGFFGLMVDNLVQVLLIIDLCRFVAGLPDDLIYERILPGVGVSLLIGNVFYGLQAQVVARRTRNADCTALPYGINTPSVIAYAFFIMGPVYRDTGDATLAWIAGLCACCVSGLIEFAGAFFAESLRRVTPRAALLGVLASVGITFIAADFALRIYASPLVGVLPLAFLLLAYFAHYKFPLRLPGGFLAVLFGTLIAWGGSLLGAADFGGVQMSPNALGASLSGDSVRWIAPTFVGGRLWDFLVANPELLVRYLTVSVPMGIINVIGSLQNIESAEAGGDRYATAPSLAVNGLGSLAAGLFGSCFPTTIYIGHPGWKALGARSSYSIVNGLFFTGIFLFGLGPFLRALIPIEAGAAIVMYIGIVITAQAFQATPRAHAPAVAIALFPALAALVLVKLGLYLEHDAVGATLQTYLENPTPQTADLPGLLALTGANSSWIVVTLLLTAIGAALIDRKYASAAVWAAAAALLTAVGAIHAYRVSGNIVHELFIWQWPTASPGERLYRAFPIAIGYALASALFAVAAASVNAKGRTPESTSKVVAESVIPDVNC
ncbi:MAG: NCS2 family permease [Planctomycetota bacterium]|nr:MAG: NCS2 family permease [Planctomycetota bacterium]